MGNNFSDCCRRSSTSHTKLEPDFTGKQAMDICIQCRLEHSLSYSDVQLQTKEDLDLRAFLLRLDLNDRKKLIDKVKLQHDKQYTIVALNTVPQNKYPPPDSETLSSHWNEIVMIKDWNEASSFPRFSLTYTNETFHHLFDIQSLSERAVN